MTNTATTRQQNAAATAATGTPPSVLSALRAVVPARGNVTRHEALRIAELQASKLVAVLEQRGLDLADGIREHHLAGLPRLRVMRALLPVSGTSHWNGAEWIITINSGESEARQRFTLLHEFKHVIDHGHASILYRTTRQTDGADLAEQAADYFAGCALVSKRDLKRAWGNGIQRPDALAEHFGVSEHAIRVRLGQTGLAREADRTPTPRCARPVTQPTTYGQHFRIVSSTNRYRRRWA